MIDREKVIKSLEIHIDWEADCIGCSYLEDGGTCIMHLQRDALELLKEQENKEREARAFIFGTLF